MIGEISGGSKKRKLEINKIYRLIILIIILILQIFNYYSYFYNYIFLRNSKIKEKSKIK